MVSAIVALAFSVPSTLTAQSGCTIPTACNFDPTAVENDGSCSWTVDCAGICGGGHILDACGNCYDPNGIPTELTFNYSGAIQTWTVPPDVTSITVEAFGAQGGGGDANSLTGGSGARVRGTFEVVPGEQFYILVGEMGETGTYQGCTIERNNNGGGGGTFFVRTDNTPYLVAGGGGGGCSIAYGTSCVRDITLAHGQTTENGASTPPCSSVGFGGVGGNGGSCTGLYEGGAGGGFYTDGQNGQNKCSGTPGGGRSFLNGGAGGTGYTNCDGGFGGGGAGERGSPGGGGGYSGGGTASDWSSYSTYGGGGGSYNSGVDQDNESGVQAGNGLLIITYDLIPECQLGCTDAEALNYDPLATDDDGSCIVDEGCIDPTACNYAPGAITSNPALCLYIDCTGECGGLYITDGCGNCYDPAGSPPICTLGCTDPTADNYDPAATNDDGSCINLEGCTDTGACNYNPTAVIDDGSCETLDCNGICGGNYVLDDCGNCLDPDVIAGVKVFNYSGEIQDWVIPEGISEILMDVRGAQGGECINSGGRGARILSSIPVTPGQTVRIMVGGTGASTCDASGGGGGSFVALSDNTPLVIAGGGSGATSQSSGNPGTTLESGADGDGCAGNGGTLGNGGGDSSFCGNGTGGGGGFYSNGGSGSSGGAMRGEAFVNGGAGGISEFGGADGGFGGGGATNSDNMGGGAGGGYSGGGAPSPANGNSGGGGGSYSQTAPIVSQTGVNLGDGLVIFSFQADIACIQGCTDPAATNYNASATTDDGSCQYLGCTDDTACNYDPLASSDDGSCLYVVDCAGVCGGQNITDACGNCYDPTAQNQGIVELSSTAYVQLVEIPAGVGSVLIEAAGGQGGSFDAAGGGMGALVEGSFEVTPGEILRVVVGGAGTNGDGVFNYAGGGGGSFVFDTDWNPMIVAGGGGGVAGTNTNGDQNASTGIDGNAGFSPLSPNDFGVGGISGEGATNNPGGFTCGGNGAGLQSDGEFGVCASAAPVNGTGILNGGFGGVSACGANINGGFGGGGGGGCHGAGGGGGYSGGGGSTGPDGNGGGGSCYNAGMDPEIVQLVNSGDGWVRLTFEVAPLCILGCTDPEATNFDPAAIADDGTCTIQGCTDPTAPNYSDIANLDDGSCQYPGCTYPDAMNFDVSANFEDGSCLFSSCSGISGCTDSTACNYDPYADTEDGSCLFVDSCGDCGGLGVSGCTYPDACNYDPAATCDDGGCDFDSCVGCMYPEASNYDPNATIDSGFCLFPSEEEFCGDGTFFDPILGECTVLPNSCPTDLNFDGTTGSLDLLLLLAVFGLDCP